MRKQDQLNELINSLTKNEKRYFKIQASAQDGDKVFVRLFDELAKSNAYVPEELIEKLKISKPVLAHTKKYLEKALLSSLRQYADDSNLKVWLNNQWQEAEILYTRKHFDMAMAITEKALKRAVDYEYFMMAYNLWALKHQILIAATNQLEESMNATRQKEHCLEQLNEVEHLLGICINFNKASNGLYDAEKELEYVSALPIFKTTPEKLKSDSARMRWHEMKHLYYYYIKGDGKTAIYHAQCKLKVFEARPALIYTFPVGYLTTLGALCGYHTVQYNIAEALKYAHQMEADTDGHRKDIPPTLCVQYGQIARTHQIVSYGAIERYDEVVKKAAPMVNNLNNTMTSHLIVIKFQYARALFYTGRYDEALKVCEAMITSTLDVRKEILMSNRLFIVMIHYALKNYSLLPNLVTSAIRWGQRQKMDLTDFDGAFYWFKKMVHLNHGDKHQQFFKQMDEAVNKKNFDNVNLDLNLPLWTRNILAGKY